MFTVVRRYISDIARAVVRAICIEALTMPAHLFITLAFIFVFAIICQRVASLARWASAMERAFGVHASTTIAKTRNSFAFVDIFYEYISITILLLVMSLSIKLMSYQRNFRNECFSKIQHCIPTVTDSVRRGVPKLGLRSRSITVSYKLHLLVDFGTYHWPLFYNTVRLDNL